jgi:hypothetical protein
MEMKTSEILRAAKALIEDPDHWVQGTYARPYREADPVNNHLMGNDPRATCWCSMGALQKALDGFSIDESWLKYEKTLNKITEPVSMLTYNDTHTHAEVMKVWDRAIALAEAEEAR